MKKKLKILFMGTPDFAVNSLDSIYRSKHDLCCVVTSPDKKSGRGQKLRTSPVKDYCIENKINLIQPDSFDSKEFIENIKKYNADIFIVVAFKILPRKVWNIPTLGSINIHASLLPNLRGAAPINWAIIHGLKITGLTSFFINEGVDTGDIIDQIETPINKTDNFGSLYEKLKNMSGNFILKTLENLNKRKSQKTIQNIINAPKLDKENTKIDWTANGKEICNKIRGLSPVPGAWCLIEGSNKIIKIYDAIFHPINDSFKNGEIYIENKKKLMVSLNNGSLEILSLMIEGKKKIHAIDFINGMKNHKIKLI